jgi:rhodanese-related sulfurtransferase
MPPCRLTSSPSPVALPQKSGVTKVANLAGGTLHWRAESLPVEGGSD